MSGRVAFGVLLIAAGLIVAAAGRPAGTLMARAQPRAMYPGPGRAGAARAILLVIGTGLVLAGFFEAFDPVGWLFRMR